MRKFLLATAFLVGCSIFGAQEAKALEADIFCQPPNSVPIPCKSDAAGNIGTFNSTSPAAGVTATIANGTITVTDTFQAILAAPGAGVVRLGCLIQNQSAVSKSMYVFVGAIGGSTKAKSVIILPNQVYQCANASGAVEQSAIAITGTNPDAWVVWSE